jgi:hypothetical protein
VVEQLARRVGRRGLQPKPVGQRLGQLAGGAERRERHEGDAVGKRRLASVLPRYGRGRVVAQRFGHRERQARLADAADAKQRDQPAARVAYEQPPDLDQLALAAEERAERRGEGVQRRRVHAGGSRWLRLCGCGWPGRRLALDEAAHLGQQFRPGRLVFQQNVIPARQRDEARPRDRRGELAPGIIRDPCVVTRVQHQRWRLHPRRQVGHVELVECAQEPHGVLHRTRWLTFSGWRTAYAIATGPPCEMPSSGKRSRPSESTTTSRSRTQASSENSSTCLSDNPQPRSS